MQPEGRFERRIMLIGGKPNKMDDTMGVHWNGETGELVRSVFSELNLDIERDTISLNAVNCTPPQHRFPTPIEIDHCRHVMVNPTIEEHSPSVVILFGSDAIYSALGPYFSSVNSQIDKFTGYQIPINGTWYCPVFAPEFVLKHKKAKHIMTIWKQHLKNALKRTQVVTPHTPTPKIEIVQDIEFLTQLPAGLYAFDYETTGLKPQMPGHDIFCASIASSPDHAWTFLLPPTKKGRQPLREFLRRKDIKKIAHNIAYEDTWSRVILKVAPRGWAWDSMQAAHILDNRPGVPGLKFQSFVHFGQKEYSQDMDEYFNTGKEYGDNSINNVHKMLKTETGRNVLLNYCGMDAILEYRLALKQMKEIGVSV